MSKADLKASLRGGLGGGLKVEPSPKRDSPLEPTSPPVAAIPQKAQVVASDESPLVKQNMVLTWEQYEGLKTLASKIQWNGQKHPERITINTVLRCFVSLAEHFEADLSQIRTEEDLKRMVHDRFLK